MIYMSKMEYSNLLIFLGTLSAFEVIWTCGNFRVLSIIQLCIYHWNLPLTSKISAVSFQDLLMLFTVNFTWASLILYGLLRQERKFSFQTLLGTGWCFCLICIIYPSSLILHIFAKLIKYNEKIMNSNKLNFNFPELSGFKNYK